MKLIDRCSSCKHLDTTELQHYGYNKCNKIRGAVSTDFVYWGQVMIDNPNTFGCIAWEAKDETN